MDSSDTDLERMLLGLILERGCRNLSQASMRIGCETEQLEAPRDSLLGRGLIRQVRSDYKFSNPIFQPYEANV